MAIIGIAGRARAGKDTVAGFLREALSVHTPMGTSWELDAFAWSLKEGVGRGVFGMDDDQLYGDRKEEVDPFWGFSTRWMLQVVGSQLFRMRFAELLQELYYEPDSEGPVCVPGWGERLDQVWVKTLLRRYHARKKGESFIVTDVRFPDETQAIRAEGGKVIKVLGHDVAIEHGAKGHVSEAHIDTLPADFVVANHGTLEDLECIVVGLAPQVVESLPEFS